MNTFRFAFSAALLALLAAGGSASAQQPQAQPTPVPTITITFKDGKSTAATTIRRLGDQILATVPVGAAMGEQGYPVGAITKIQFPEPAQIQAVTQKLMEGNNPGALVQIEPIIQYYDTYKEIPGSWWAAAMRLKLRAFLNLHRDAPSDELIDAMVKAAPADTEAARMASIFQAASLSRKGQNDKAIAIFDDVIKNSTNDETLAYAWVNKGDCLFAMQQFDPALLAYLHVPVFYPDEKILLPSVMLGSGKCYLRIENLPEAQNTFNQLLDQYPSSPEAQVATAELKKLAKSNPVAPAAPAADAATPTPTPATSGTTTPTPTPAPAAQQ